VTESVDIVLRNARQANSIVVVVGAGLSAAAGIPSWESLISEADLTEVYGTASRGTEQFASTKPTARAMRQLLADTLTDFSQQAAPSPAHLAIAKLAPRAVVTTNYDTLLEDAIDGSGRSAFVLTRNDDIEPEPEDAIPVFKIHGSIRDPSSISFDSAGSLLASSGTQPATWLLRAVMAVSLVIAVGFDLNSKDLGSLYERFGDTVHGSWFVIPAENKSDPVAKTLWTNRGVQIVETANISAFFEDLKNRLETLLEPPSYTRQGRQIFVSHAVNSAASSTVYNLLREFNLDPVDIKDMSISGQTIMDRLDYLVESSEAAVVILGPESSGDHAAGSNVIFELGWLLGKLGRDRVLTVVTPDALLPTDLGGFRYFVFEPARPESLEAGLRNWLEGFGKKT
jgi:predicted nucleotide-binding protein